MAFSINQEYAVIEEFLEENVGENSDGNSDDLNSDERFLLKNSCDNEVTSSPPQDIYSVCFLIFYLQGIVTILPWNFFITSNDYWMYKFRHINDTLYTDSNDDNRTDLQIKFTSYVSVFSSIASLVFVVITMLTQNRISIHKSIIGSLIGMFVLFTISLTFININTDKWQFQFFILTIIIVILLSACSAILSGSIFALVGLFDSAYITATISGQALGGVFASITEIVSLSIGESSINSAIIYFAIGSCTILIAIVTYVCMLKKSAFFKYHQQRDKENQSSGENVVSFRAVLGKISGLGIVLLFVYCFSLAIFPAVTVLIESEHRGNSYKWNDVFFVPTVCYLLFNAGDYFGRILSGYFKKPVKVSYLMPLSLARIVFIPLFMLCNAQPRRFFDVFFTHDYQYIVIMIAFALSNGYLANISMICVQSYVDFHERKLASSMMVVFLSIGLCFGSALSLLFVELL